MHLVACASATLSRRAEAQPRDAVSLVYERPAGDRACRDGRWLRQSFASRLGHDPFAEGSEESSLLARDAIAQVRVAIVADGATRRVRVDFEAADGSVRTTREPSLRVPPARCGELTRLAMTVVMTRMVELPRVDVRTATTTTVPTTVSTTAPTVAPATTAATSPTTTATASPPAVEPRPGPVQREPVVTDDLWTVSATLGVAAVFGATPTVNPSVQLGVWVQRRRWRFGAEIQGDLAVADASFGTQRARGDRLLGGLVGCVRWSPIAACAVARGGAQRVATASLEDPHVVPQVEVGGRVVGEWEVSRRVALWAQVEAMAPLWQTQWNFGASEATATTAWQATWVAALGAGVRWSF